MPREGARERRREDDRFEALKRRVIHLSRLEGDLLLLDDGVVCLVRAREVKSATTSSTQPIIARLRSHGTLDQPTLERYMKLEGPPVAIDAPQIAAAHRDVRALDQRPLLDLARENKRALSRYGRIDAAWLEAKRKRIEHVGALYTLQRGAEGRPKERWFDGVVELVRAMRGEEEASALSEAEARVRARAAERRKEARERVAIITHALDTGVMPDDPELAALATRLEASRELPGRSRRRRVLDVLRRAVAWPGAPADVMSSQALQPLASSRDLPNSTYARLVEEAGAAMASALPIVRDPSLRERTLELLAHLGLVFAIRDHGVPAIAEEEAVKLLGTIGEVLELASSTISLADAITLAKIPMKRPTRMRIARWVAEGLEMELVVEAAEKKHNNIIENLVNVDDLRSARAYATWATRLSAHYEARGIAFSLSPELFAHLPKNEDLAVLAMCLMDQVVDPTKSAATAAKTTTGSNSSDPIAILDATLALFQKLPAKAKNILSILRDTKASASAGEGRKLYPDLAAWLDDDALLDRCIHIARLAGETVPLSAAIREDFEHVERTRGERAHLEKLEKASRSAPQQGRLDALLRVERTLAGSPKGRTKRRIAERIARLLPTAYRRELDATFREILEEAWGIAVPSLTPAWRDAVRFLLVIDENRKMLTTLLRKAAKSPGRDVKRDAFAKNDAWIESVKARINVDAWLAPRKKEIVVRAAATAGTESEAEAAGAEQRFIIELEEDPLEVLRMGIPFGTCLALDSGVNASATVMNAIEANKRVLYVRNATTKSIVGRKLLAISKDLTLIGYNLYVSAQGATEIALRAAVLAECRALSIEVGAPLASTGEPLRIHDGFWYDDGTVPFDEDVDVAAYCKSLALPPPPEWFEDLGKEARAWRACETGDTEAALAILSAWDNGPANRALGAWIVDRLGMRAAEKRAAEDSSVFIALARSLASGSAGGSVVDGMVRALDLATRVPEYIAHHRLSPILARFGPSPKIAVGLVDMGLRAMKRHKRTTDHGLAHLTLDELPPMFDDVAGALDLLDSIEPVWAHVEKALPACERCCFDAIERSASIVEAIYSRAPDPDVVGACLMSRHRSAISKRAALRVAARHVLPNGGDRALTRLATLHPKMFASPDGIAALLRQSQVDVITDSFARKVPKPSMSPFEALRDLVRCENLDAILGHYATVAAELTQVAVDAWYPGPWELAWRRRRRDDALQRSLFEHAARAPRTATRAMELLALLGDLERVGALDHVTIVNGRHRAAGEQPTKARNHDAPHACRRTAASLADQVRAEYTQRIDPNVTSLPHADALYVDLARRALVDDTLDDELVRDAARSVVVECNDEQVVDWRRLLVACARRGDGAAVRRILDHRIGRRPLTPSAIVDVWQLPEARESLAKLLERLSSAGDWAARIWAAEREAAARGLSVEGLVERVALALVAAKEEDEAVDVETLDELRSIASSIMTELPPAEVAACYDKLPDTLSVAIFVRAFRRLPVDRAAAIREAVKKKADDSDAGKARRAWLSSSSSIRRD